MAENLAARIAETLLMEIEALIADKGLITLVNLEGETTPDWIAETNDGIRDVTVAGGPERAYFLVRLNDERVYKIEIVQQI
jgi:hypothetical protein